MRDMIWDRPKNISQLIKEQGKTCSTPKCGQPLTQMKGPGESTLCRECQLKLIEYGGMGRRGRPHTMHRTFQCEECKWLPLEDPRISKIEDEYKRRMVARITIHADHSATRKADGGGDDADNIRGICYVCHAAKTVLNEDWRKGEKSSD